MEKEEIKEMLTQIEDMKVERDRKKNWYSTLSMIVMIITLLTILSSVVVAFTVVREGANRALIVAEKAKEMSENNAREFAFFKGEVNAKLDNINKNVDRIARVVENLEVVSDGKSTK